MKKMLRFIAIILLATLSFSSCAAKKEEEAQTMTIFAMDTVIELRVYGSEMLLDEAEEYIRGLEKEISVTLPESGIYRLNDTGGAELNAEASALLSRSLELCDEMDGALDITIYPLTRAWGFTSGEYRVPDRQEIECLLDLVDYTVVRVEGTRVSVPDGVMVDLGSVAKGWASQKITEMWKKDGVRSGLLNLGGNVQAIGRKPDGSLWRVGVREPEGDGILGFLEIEDMAVITSGGYERYFENDGEVYWHILDPGQGVPARNGLISATAVGKDGSLCDALSTSLFVLGPERAIELWRDRNDFEAILVTEDNNLLVTQGLETFFTPETIWGEKMTIVKR